METITHMDITAIINVTNMITRIAMDMDQSLHSRTDIINITSDQDAVVNTPDTNGMTTGITIDAMIAAMTTTGMTGTEDVV